MPGFLNLYDGKNLAQFRQHWLYPKNVESATPPLISPESKVQPTDELMKSGYGNETPTSIPGGKVITPVASWQAILQGLQSPSKKVLVLSAIEEKLGLPTALSANFAAPGTSLNKNDPVQWRTSYHADQQAHVAGI